MVGTSGADGYGDVDAQVAAAHERADRAGAWAAEMEQITGRGSALRGGVTVEVDLGGTVVGLGISDAAAAHGGQSVAHAIREAHAQAQRSVREQAERSTSATWGAGSATAAHLLQGMSVGDAIRLLDLKPQYQHLLRSDPALWDKAASDALREGIPSNATDAAKVLEAAIRRQVDGHP